MMVLPRLVTSLVAAPLFLWALYLGSLPFVVFVSVLVLLALWEFHRMAEIGGYATQSWWGIAGGMMLLLALCFPGLRADLPFQNQAPALTLMVVVAAYTLRELARRDKSLSMLRLSMSLLGTFFVVWPLAHLVLLRELRHEPLYTVGRDAAFYLVFLIWVQDITAWAVGLSVGKRRLAVQISPKKSWEGAAAGLAAAVLLSLFLREVWLKTIFSRTEIVALSAALGILAQVSDLAESLMKRCFGVKDSSDLLPGHGGILDRFDSFLLAAPFLYYYLVLTGRVG
ncbi:MAG TPA: phosphatidate cytidylyltransferase [Elusimicrobiota bacterium]|nr:phosphatidate cytidylyltransferase [Elusimicrobiota bacterium]